MKSNPRLFPVACPRIVSCLIGAWLLILGPALSAAEPLSLAGSWRFQLDRANQGIAERWFEQTLPGQVTLPGTLSGQGLGDDISVDTPWMGGIVDQSWFTAPEFAPYREPGHVKVPFWLQPEKYYAGAAWFQRDMEVPEDWQGRRVTLTLERPHWETRVWLDGRFLGANDSLSTPHQYDLGPDLAPGRHRLTIRVDNGLVVDVGINSHSISDHTQGNWNGLVGRLELSAHEPVWIEDLQVYPDVAGRQVKVRGRLGNATGQAGEGVLLLTTRLARSEAEPELAEPLDRPLPSTRVNVVWDEQGGRFEADHPLGRLAQPWDEFHPALYRLTATLRRGERQETRTVTIGLRQVSTEGRQLLINGRSLFLRGTLECAIFPRTGHPPTEVSEWKRIIGVAKAHGLNHYRFHSWCPPEAAFEAADELGFYFQVEIASWANQSTTLGDGKPVDAWLYREAERILQAYGNHPSFLLMAYGNEPGGRRHHQYLIDWLNHWKAAEPRVLHTGGSGWPQLAENQFHVTPDPRVQGWGQGLRSRINSQPPETRTDYRKYIEARDVPVISHEIGQWCVYPNFEEMPKYTGYLKARNFEIFRDRLEAHHLGDLARLFLLASGKLQALCYKEDIESALRTPAMGGFQLLDLHDFPGQGTALVGVLDPFWETKGYIAPETFRRFAGPTVPLARLSQRVLTTEESLEADLEVAHFGAAPLLNAVATWELVDDDRAVLASGNTQERVVPIGNGIGLGRVLIPLRSMPAPQRCRLVVRLEGQPELSGLPGGHPLRSEKRVYAENDWEVWIYPSQPDLSVPPHLTVCNELHDGALATLQAGGKVLLCVPPRRVQGDHLGPVALGFSSIFWNTAWTGRQPPHTLGILCDPRHPLFRHFPTDYHSNWQWWYLVSQAGALILDDLPPECRPVVQVIDDWVTARKLGLLVEAKVAGGSLMICSIDLLHNPQDDPVTRQFRHSLLRYLAGDAFQPAVALSVEEVRGLMAPPSAMERLGARLHHATSFEPGYEPDLAWDGNPATLWHSRWTGDPPSSFPHELQIALNEAVTLRGFTVLPRQDNNRNGWIKEYACYVSDDGRNWGDPVARGAFPATSEQKTVLFSKPATGRFVRLVALSGHVRGPWVSLAEFGLLEP